MSPHSQAPETSREHRLVQLDALRGLAAMAVVLFHFTYRYDELLDARSGLLFRFPLGEFGVALFFMLSGFVILMSLERTDSARRFALARVGRLYPTFWVALVLSFLATRFAQLPGLQVPAYDAVLNLTMLPRLVGAPFVDGVYWSLQVELLFYLGIGLLWFSRLRSWLLPTFAVWIVLGVAENLAVPALEHFDPLVATVVEKLSALLNLPFIHVFAIGVGLYEFHAHARRSGLALVGLALGAHLIEHGWFELAVLTGLTAVVALAVAGRLSLLACKPLLMLGAISYPLYLVHQNIGYCVLRWMQARGADGNLAVVVATLLVVIVAYALHRAVEMPAMHWLQARRRASRVPLAQVSVGAKDLVSAMPS